MELDINSKMWESFLVNHYEQVKDQKDENGKPKWTTSLLLKTYLSEKVPDVLQKFLEDFNEDEEKNHMKEVQEARNAKDTRNENRAIKEWNKLK